MDQKLQRISLSLVKASRRSQIPADQDSFTTMSPGARIVSPGQRPRRPSMEDLFELNNENGIHQRRIMTPTLTKSPSSPGFKGDSLRRPVSREVSRDFSSRSSLIFLSCFSSRRLVIGSIRHLDFWVMTIVLSR